jgi:hypothetical protein
MGHSVRAATRRPAAAPGWQDRRLKALSSCRWARAGGMSNVWIEQRAKPVDATIAGDMNSDGEHIDGIPEADVPLLTGLRPQPGEPT